MLQKYGENSFLSQCNFVYYLLSGRILFPRRVPPCPHISPLPLPPLQLPARGRAADLNNGFNSMDPVRPAFYTWSARDEVNTLRNICRGHHRCVGFGSAGEGGGLLRLLTFFPLKFQIFKPLLLSPGDQHFRRTIIVATRNIETIWWIKEIFPPPPPINWLCENMINENSKNI